MGPGENNIGGHLCPPIYTIEGDKLQWCKDVRYWARTALGCAEGGDTKAKGMLAALDRLLFGSLPSSRQQMVEKAVESRELVIYPLDPTYSQDELAVIEPIIELVAKDSATDAIKPLAKLNKTASKCTRKADQYITTYIELFLLPAQAYLNLTSADRSSAESQNLAMTLLTNAKLSQDTFSSVMSNLVSSTKNEAKQVTPSIAIDAKRIDIIASLLSSVASGQDIDDLKEKARESAYCLQAAHRRLTQLSSNSSFIACISIADAIVALEVGMGRDELKQAISQENKVSRALMTHLTLAQRFQRKHTNYRNHNWKLRDRNSYRDQQASNDDNDRKQRNENSPEFKRPRYHDYENKRRNSENYKDKKQHYFQ